MSSIDIREEAGVRTLHFGSDWIQGAMRIARPWTLELDYTKEMMASLLLREDSRFPRKALLIGLGAASLTKFLYRNQPLTKLTVVEIEPAVVAAARQGLRLRPRALVTTMYARLMLADLFLHGIGGAKYDQLTDLIIRQFFDVQPPRGAAVTFEITGTDGSRRWILSSSAWSIGCAPAMSGEW